MFPKTLVHYNPNYHVCTCKCTVHTYVNMYCHIHNILKRHMYVVYSGWGICEVQGVCVCEPRVLPQLAVVYTVCTHVNIKEYIIIILMSIQLFMYMTTPYVHTHI